MTSEIVGNPNKTKVVGQRIALQTVGVIGLLVCLRALSSEEFAITYSYPLLFGLLVYVFVVMLFRMGMLNLSIWITTLAIWIDFTLVLVTVGEIDRFVFYGNFILVFLVGMFLYDIQVVSLIILMVASVSGCYWMARLAILPASVVTVLHGSNTILHTIFLILAMVIARGFGRELDRILDRSENLSQQFQAIFEQSADAIFLTDLNFVIQELNPRAMELVGQSLEDVVGQNIYDYVPQHTKKQVEELANDTLVDGKISKIKMSFINKHGVRQHFKISTNLIYRNEETPDHIQIIVRDVTEAKLVEERIQRLALQDHLTKVENRLSLDYRVNSLIATMNRGGGRFALVYFDLDNFKSVNDRYGHFIGDQLLIAFTKRLDGATREEDFLARMGGDEFVLILENYLSDDELETTLTRISSTLTNPFKIGDHLIYLEASYGISRYPEDGDDFEDLLKIADSAMYSNKRAVS